MINFATSKLNKNMLKNQKWIYTAKQYWDTGVGTVVSRNYVEKSKQKWCRMYNSYSSFGAIGLICSAEIRLLTAISSSHSLIDQMYCVLYFTTICSLGAASVTWIHLVFTVLMVLLGKWTPLRDPLLSQHWNVRMLESNFKMIAWVLSQEKTTELIFLGWHILN